MERIVSQIALPWGLFDQVTACNCVTTNPESGKDGPGAQQEGLESE